MGESRDERGWVIPLENYASRDERKRSTWITTYTGGRFYPLDLERTVFDIRDIAHGLANTCRFGGQIPTFYSVARHSILVSEHVDRPEEALWGLFHDASEAYLCDIPAPIKGIPSMEGYRSLERQVMRAIVRWFGLDPVDEPATVKRVDRELLRNEAKQFGFLNPDWDVYGERDLGLTIVPETTTVDEFTFLARYAKLVQERQVRAL